MAIKGIILGTCGLLLSFTSLAQTDVNPTGHHSCSAHAAKGTVALTFDDGPSVFTKRVMSILDKYHIKATFFVIGENAKRHPQFLKQIAAEGNVIGNHTLTHPLVSKLSPEELQKEVNETEQIVYGIIGIKPQVFRFPYGGESAQARHYVESQGLIPVHWGYSSEDYRRPGSAVIAKRVISHAKSGQVILMHDGPAHREQTVAALPKIIEGIKKKGLGFSVLCS